MPGECLVNNVPQELLRLLTRAKGDTDQDFRKHFLNLRGGDFVGRSSLMPGVVGSNCVFHLPTPGGSRDLRRTVLYPTGDDKARAPFDIALEQYRAVPCQYQQSYRLLSVHVNSCADLHVLWGGLQPESAL